MTELDQDGLRAARAGFLRSLYGYLSPEAQGHIVDHPTANDIWDGHIKAAITAYLTTSSQGQWRRLDFPPVRGVAPYDGQPVLIWDGERIWNACATPNFLWHVGIGYLVSDRVRGPVIKNCNDYAVVTLTGCSARHLNSANLERRPEGRRVT